jgi:SAM-dependent methyltransferase
MTKIERSARRDHQRVREELLARITTILACPECKSAIDQSHSEADRPLGCPRCGTALVHSNGQIVTGGFTADVVEADWLNRSKESAKRLLGSAYPLFIKLLAPVHGKDRVPEFLKTFDLATELVADLGSGTKHYGEPVICVDGAGYPNVHVVSDLEKLPFRDSALAGLVSIAVLEHVPDPKAHVREMWRVLRPGGRVLCYIPFIQGFHASPHDYQRFTLPGLRRLFADFEVIGSEVGAGPTSGLLWILQEWLALAFSFGSRRLYHLLVPLTWILSPLKYLDVMLARHPDAQVIASSFLIEARKPVVPADRWFSR